MGDDTFENEDQMLKMWGESMRDVNCKSALINYEDFVLLMKGQKQESTRGRRISLAAVPEIPAEDDEVDHHDVTPVGSFNERESPVVLPLNAMGEASVRKPSLSPKEISPNLPLGLLPLGSPSRTSSGGSKGYARMGSNSAPPTPIHYGKRFDEIDQAVGDSPLSLEGDERRISFSEQCAVFTMPALDLTPPQTPVRGPADYITPTVARATLDPQLISQLSPPDLSLPGLNSLHAPMTRGDLLARGLSVSLDEKDTFSSQEEAESRRSMMFKRDSRRAMAIPEHTHNVSDIDKVIEDKTKTPLVVNRKLYRAHREFRHAVTEACKRFEDEQMRRAKETLKAQESANGAKHSAGLVMRHGQALTDQSIKTFLKKTLEEQQKQVDQANRRGGRGRRSRKKTISDMSGMLGGPALPEAAPTEVRKSVQGEPPEVLAPVKENENLLRNPTKPGEFRKTTYDPFQRKTILFDNGRSTVPGGTTLSSVPVTPPPPLA